MGAAFNHLAGRHDKNDVGMADGVETLDKPMRSAFTHDLVKSSGDGDDDGAFGYLRE